MTAPLSRAVRSQIENVVYTRIVHLERQPWKILEVTQQDFTVDWKADSFPKLLAKVQQPDFKPLLYQVSRRESRTLVGKVETETAKSIEIREISIGPRLVFTYGDWHNDSYQESSDEGSVQTSDEMSDEESEEASNENSDGGSDESLVEGSEQVDEGSDEGSDEAYQRELDEFSVGDLEDITDSDEDL
ncbi:hypothetical protein PG996_011370 [Apiospora saccharicola]|uniref:Uncharacterized protein n=1 Tax=Apiospora saccharicola TaxID=335842 RepID=A0ABR1UEV4_9PEZI